MRLTSLILSLIAIIVSLWAMALVQTSPSAAEIRTQVEQQILEDAWAELQPVYKQFGMNTTKPANFRELIRPLVEVKPIN